MVKILSLHCPGPRSFSAQGAGIPWAARHGKKKPLRFSKKHEFYGTHLSISVQKLLTEAGFVEHRKPTVSEASLRSQKPWSSMPWGPWHHCIPLPRPASVHQEPWRERHGYRMPPHPLSFLKAILQISSNRKLITLIDLTFEKEMLDSLSSSWETDH